MSKVVSADFAGNAKKRLMKDELEELRKEFNKVNGQIGHLGDYGRKLAANIALYEKELRK